MRVAVLFPGQGEELAPALPGWYEQSASVRALVALAACTVGMTPDAVLARGARALTDVQVLQAVSVAVSLGVLEELTSRGVEPSLVGGHSLGEVATASAAGLFDAERAVEVAAFRGQLMAEAAARFPGGMVALDSSAPEDIDAMLAVGSAAGVIGVSAYNSPIQTTLSGGESAVRALLATGRVIRVPVSGPWHSQSMSDAVTPLLESLQRATGDSFVIPMLFNATGRVETDADTAPALLAEQLVRPIRWTEEMRALRAEGVTDVITIGPARAMRGLVRDCLGGQVAVHAVEHFENLNLEALCA